MILAIPMVIGLSEALRVSIGMLEPTIVDYTLKEYALVPRYF